MTKIALTPAERLVRIGGVIGEAITPFVSSNAPVADRIDTWQQVFEAEDSVNGSVRRRDIADVRVLLQILAKHWRRFRNPTTALQTAWARDLLQALNIAAHVPTELSEFDVAYHAGMARKLVDSLGAPSGMLERIENIAVGSPPERADEVALMDPSTSLPGLAADQIKVNSPQVSAASPAEALLESDATEDADDSAIADLLDGLIEDRRRDILARLVGRGHGLEAVTEKIGDALVTLVYRPAINFALVHNGVSPLAGIGVINTHPENTLHVTSLHASLASLSTTDARRSDRLDSVGTAHDWVGPGLEIPAGDFVVLDGPDLAWELPAGRFIDIDEAAADTMEFDFGADGKSRRVSLPVRLLAHDEWTSATVPEVLAAFIRPRAAAVSQLLSAAADILQKVTGDPGMVGYQRGEERVRATAEAIYEAIRDVGIRYSEPPASFEDTGQKLRSHDTVVTSRFGTCIDLAVLYAAVLEEAGLNPVVVMFKGHAYSGVFLSDVSATSFVVSGEEHLSNLFGGNLMVPVEMTAVTVGSSLSFDNAVASAYTRAGHGREVTYVLDVRAAHRRVRPLPRVTEDEGGRVVEKVVTAAAPRARTAGPGEVDGPQLAAKSYPARVQRWRSDLLDLSLRNPLLKLSESRGLQILVPPGSLADFEDRLNSNRAVRLVPHDDLSEIHRSRGLTSARQLPEEEREAVFSDENAVYAYSARYGVSRRLTAIRREARSVLEETGANSLFLTLGSFRWKDRSGTKEGRAPLYLLPVHLTGSNSRPYEVSVEPGAVVQPNYCLIEKLQQEHGVTLDVLERPHLDDSGIDITRILRELRDRFVAHGLDFSVDEQVQLAILQFATIDLWRDVSDNWEQLAKSPIVGHLIERPGEEFNDAGIEPVPAPSDEADAYLPVPADGSQLEAVRAATAGRSFVLEGPPGTGKSQTITNMIADGLARGRTILFVAEKQAALGVVHDRLQRIGLAPLILNVHGQTQTLNTVREQLRRAIAEEGGGNTEAFEVLRSRLRDRIEDLSRYPAQLHGRGTGPSIWAQYQRCLQLESEQPAAGGWMAEEIEISTVTLNADPVEVDKAVREVTRLARRVAGAKLAPEWSLVVALPDAEESTESAARPARVLESASRLVDAIMAVPDDLAEIYDRLSGAHDRLKEWLAGVQAQTSLLPSQLDDVVLDPQLVENLRQSVLQFRNTWGLMAAILAPAAAHADLPRLRQQYRESQTASLLKRRKLERLAHDEIRALAIPEQGDAVLREPLRFLSDLEAFLVAKRELTERARPVIRRRSVDPFDPGFDAELSKTETLTREHHRQRALTLELLEAGPEIGDLLDSLVRSDVARAKTGALLGSLERLERELRAFIEVSGATPDSVERWSGGRQLMARLKEAAPVWRSGYLEEAARAETERLLHYQAELERFRRIGLGGVAEELAAGRPAKDLKAAVELACAREALNRSLRNSGLDVFDEFEYGEAVASYLETSRQLKTRMKTELAARLVSSAGRRGAVTPALRKEVDRRRGGSIRSLFGQYGREILAVTPCVLMSPASVAKFLPPDAAHFDVVIFDEASQIRVADAIGALGRAEAAVIAGDSKQMPPTAMFSAGPGAGEEGAELGSSDGLLAVADQESILSEAVGSGFEQKWLSWHYRSRDESLIAFSNAKYYRGKLAVFPSPPEERSGFGISTRFIGGTFDRGATRTNRAEAEAIVEAIHDRIVSEPLVSLGVITFNTEQRDLILDLLEQSTDELIRAALSRDLEALFVKNLENVQGDERDVILFSLAFSRDPETGRLPLNFGPLNRAGGERRLNVAITRARTAVTLFSSFRSADIDLDRSRVSSEGLAHLKDYLLLAEKGEVVGAFQQADDYNLYRDEIAAALTATGLQVASNVGTSKFRVDLAVRASEKHGWLAVTLDSPEWAQRSIVADREALPTTILKAVMGWQGTLQLLLPMWIRDSQQVVEKVRLEALALLLPVERDLGVESESKMPSGAEAVKAPPAEPTVWADDGLAGLDAVAEAQSLLETVTLTEEDPLAPALVRSTVGDGVSRADASDRRTSVNLSGAYDYIEAPAGLVGARDDLDRLDDVQVRGAVRSQVDEIIAIEAPIEATRLAKLLAKRYGLNRAHQSRVDAILGCSPRRPEHVQTFGRFYWPDDIDLEQYTGFRPRLDFGAVAVDEISHREIANAFASVIREQGEQTQDDLVREVAGIFGYNRLGPRIRERFDAVITWALRTKRLGRTDDGLIGSAEERLV